ncbi:hypothetical protein MPER_03371, partial [Moniliophthora perniciosa FA553]
MYIGEGHYVTGLKSNTDIRQFCLLFYNRPF